jgi:hypothetical protein
MQRDKIVLNSKSEIFSMGTLPPETQPHSSRNSSKLRLKQGSSFDKYQVSTTQKSKYSFKVIDSPSQLDALEKLNLDEILTPRGLKNNL